MHETYRMLGREHELDLEREARSRRQAKLAAERASDEVPKERTRKRTYRFLPQPLRTRLAG